MHMQIQQHSSEFIKRYYIRGEETRKVSLRSQSLRWIIIANTSFTLHTRSHWPTFIDIDKHIKNGKKNKYNFS